MLAWEAEQRDHKPPAAPPASLAPLPEGARFEHLSPDITSSYPPDSTTNPPNRDKTLVSQKHNHSQSIMATLLFSFGGLFQGTHFQLLKPFPATR